MAEMTRLLDQPDARISRSAIAVGMKQGLREPPMLLRGFPIAVRQSLADAFGKILAEEAPGFASIEAQKLERILERGRLRNENEYYLVRHRLDEVEADASKQGEVGKLLELLGGFEAHGGTVELGDSHASRA